MALTIPQAQLQDGRSAASSYDANVTVWPVTKNGTYDVKQRTGWATVNKTISKGPDAVGSYDTVIVEYQDVFWFLPVNTAITVPAFIDTILTNDAQYTWA